MSDNIEKVETQESEVKEEKETNQEQENKESSENHKSTVENSNFEIEKLVEAKFLELWEKHNKADKAPESDKSDDDIVEF